MLDKNKRTDGTIEPIEAPNKTQTWVQNRRSYPRNPHFGNGNIKWKWIGMRNHAKFIEGILYPFLGQQKKKKQWPVIIAIIQWMVTQFSQRIKWLLLALFDGVQMSFAIFSLLQRLGCHIKRKDNIQSETRTTEIFIPCNRSDLVRGVSVIASFSQDSQHFWTRTNVD